MALAQNTTTIVKPNGGECLTVGQAYTIEFSWSGPDIEHVALYYRSDGQQPAHLDSSTIKHPINVPQQGTTWDWTPSSSHIAETGRIWVDGHERNHASLNTWDSSNANFSVRSSCAAAVGAAGEPPPSGRAVRRVIRPPIGFEEPAQIAEIIPSRTAARLRFLVPWERRLYRVRLRQVVSDLSLITIAEKDLTLGPGEIVEFRLDNLAPNTPYGELYFIQAYDFTGGFESTVSEMTPPFWTLLDAPQGLELTGLTATSAVVHLAEPIVHLGEGRTELWFENITQATSSGWQGRASWEATGLAPASQYQFWVKARNGAGVETASSAPLTLVTPPLPSPKPSVEEQEREKLNDLHARIRELTRLIQELEKSLGPRAGPTATEVGVADRRRPAVVSAPREPVTPPPEVPRAKAPSAPPPAPPPPSPRPPQTFVVVIDERGFNPPTLEIQVGDAVRWISKIDTPYWPASDPHPTHTGLPSFDALGDILRGESYRYIFRKPGIWPYHNHTQAKAEEEAASGVILVK